MTPFAGRDPVADVAANGRDPAPAEGRTVSAPSACPTDDHRATGDRLVGLLQRHGERLAGHARRRDRRAARSGSTWGNEGAVQLLGYGLDDLRALPVDAALPDPRAAVSSSCCCAASGPRGMTLPGPHRQRRRRRGRRHDHAVPGRPDVDHARALSTANEQERALRATADAHERRFSALTERSPVPTLLSEQGMRLAHVNDAFCTLVGRRAEQLLGTGWIDTIHPDDLDARHRAGRRRPRGRRGRDPGPPGPRRRHRADDGHPLRPPVHPRASAPASSAPSRTSPTGWPSRRSSPTRPTTTR